MIDSHPGYLNGLSYLLRQVYPELKMFVWLSVYGIEKILNDLRPDLIILGVNDLPTFEDLERVNSIKRCHRPVKLLLLYNELTIVLPYLDSAPDGIIGKTTDLKELIECLRVVTSGGEYFDNQVSKWMAQRQ